MKCPMCRGTGEIHSHNPKCPECDGKGEVPDPATFNDLADMEFRRRMERMFHGCYMVYAGMDEGSAEHLAEKERLLKGSGVRRLCDG